MATLEERFWVKVNKTDTCWLWTANKSYYGYGRIRIGSRKVVAHRVSWDLAHPGKPVPDALDHICRNKLCVNPRHLRVATKKQNAENLCGPNADNTSGFRGVSWNKRAAKWAGYVRHANKTIYIGLFEDVDEAAEACRLKRVELFTYNDLDRAVS